MKVRRLDCGGGMLATDCRELLRNLRKLLKILGVMEILITCAVKLINRYGISKIKIRIKSGVRLLERSALLPL